MLIPLKRYILYRYESLGDFCNAMGLAPAQLSRMLRGQQEMPLELVGRISKALNVSPETVMKSHRLGVERSHKKRMAKITEAIKRGVTRGD